MSVFLGVDVAGKCRSNSHGPRNPGSRTTPRARIFLALVVAVACTLACLLSELE